MDETYTENCRMYILTKFSKNKFTVYTDLNIFISRCFSNHNMTSSLDDTKVHFLPNQPPIATVFCSADCLFLAFSLAS